MKFTTAWANVMAQNVTLKLTVGILSACTFIFCITTVKLATREPLIVDRECYSRVAVKGNQKRTSMELESFVEEALGKRFNSKVKDFRDYLSEDEVQYRIKEQDELAKKGVIQRVIVSNVKVDGSTAVVEADRLIVVGKVRSSIYFPLKINLSTIDRSESNPYGLMVTKVSPQPVNGETK